MILCPMHSPGFIHFCFKVESMKKNKTAAFSRSDIGGFSFFFIKKQRPHGVDVALEAVATNWRTDEPIGSLFLATLFRPWWSCFSLLEWRRLAWRRGYWWGWSSWFRGSGRNIRILVYKMTCPNRAISFVWPVQSFIPIKNGAANRMPCYFPVCQPWSATQSEHLLGDWFKTAQKIGLSPSELALICTSQSFWEQSDVQTLFIKSDGLIRWPQETQKTENTYVFFKLPTNGVKGVKIDL